MLIIAFDPSISISASSINSIINDKTVFKLIEQSLFHNEIGKTILQLTKPPSPFEMHTVVFGIKPINMETIDNILNDVSNPQSSNYGNYLTYNEIMNLCIPTKSVEYVESYFNTLQLFGSNNIFNNNIERIFKVSRKTLHGEYLSVTAPIWAFNILFNTEFHKFQNMNSKHIAALSNSLNKDDSLSSSLYAIRALSYSLPLELFDHIGTVFHTIQHPFAVQYVGDKKFTSHNTGKSYTYPNKKNTETQSSTTTATDTTPKSRRLDPTIPDYYSGDGYITPDLIKTHYDIFIKGTNSSPAQLVYASIGQTYSMADLLAFETVFKLDQTPIIKTKGGHKVMDTCNHPESCLEANLDIQYMIAVAQGVPTTYWYEPDYSSSSFTIFLADVNNEASPPKVISISYGMSESAMSPIEKYFFDLEAKKLLLRGLTILAASGDSGATNAENILTCGMFLLI